MGRMKLLKVRRSMTGFDFGVSLPAGGGTDLIRRRRPGLARRVWAKLRDKSPWQVPVGYEDEMGFHYGITPAGPANVVSLAK